MARMSDQAKQTDQAWLICAFDCHGKHHGPPEQPDQLIMPLASFLRTYSAPLRQETGLTVVNPNPVPELVLVNQHSGVIPGSP
ncbi:MAG: hypothetical protein JRI25_09185 [Deltaproteobacteria bacterium]|nr:hypothetical protein [Deltaproteobacteria bacterium]